MGATVGLAAKGLLPDSSVPTTSARGPVSPAQDVPLKDALAAQRAVDPISTTVLPGKSHGQRLCRRSSQPSRLDHTQQ